MRDLVAWPRWAPVHGAGDTSTDAETHPWGDDESCVVPPRRTVAARACGVVDTRPVDLQAGRRGATPSIGSGGAAPQPKKNAEESVLLGVCW
jgi:hypothetical protein